MLSPRFLALYLLLSTLACRADDSRAQVGPFVLADTLRGSLNEFRSCYDVRHYALDLRLQPRDSSLAGEVAIAYEGVFASDIIQLDLAPELEVTRVTQAGQALDFSREGAVLFVGLVRPTTAGRRDTVVVAYRGRPLVAANPPWDGGLIWKVDSLGRPFYSVSCEGIGASTWWPNKDHLSDEPDSVSFALTVPNPLRVVSNGQFRGVDPGRTTSRYRFAVSYPINNYNVTFYAGHYLSLTDTLHSPRQSAPLAIRYDVLDYNLERARRHFAQVKPMLRCYAGVLGDYPFWRDGYRLVEAPMLGMEHQSAIAYGNGYQRGYNGGMIPAGMDWDYLIIHESGHEYFGNALSCTDHAEMWLHESFTTYLEALYVECRYGHDSYNRYLISQLGFIENAAPIIGPIGVNYLDFPNNDHYFKGSWVLHTFRTLVGDEAFLDFLREFYEAHAIGPVTTTDWLAAVTARFGPGYETFWRQYLYHPAVPILRVLPAAGGGTIAYFDGAVPGFSLPLKLGDDELLVSDRPTGFAQSTSDWHALALGDYLLEYDLRQAE